MKKEDYEHKNIINEMLINKEVLKMKNFRQHFGTTCFDHCYSASFICYKIAKKFKWDYRSVARAAMVHDLFLYDWRESDNRENKWHAFTHPSIACKKASKEFFLSEKEKDIIKTHMWPLTIKFPTSKEGLLLTVVDKYCATVEVIPYFMNEFKTKKLYKYSYMIYLFFIRLLK